MRLARCCLVLWAVCAVCALAGCGLSPRQQVRAKVEQFAQATASHDYRTLCTQVLAPGLIARLSAAGLDCVQAMKVFSESVTKPTISVSQITIKGATASAVVLAGATGQTGALESIQLVKTARGWRLASLAAPR